jgi:hypothetical protein
MTVIYDLVFYGIAASFICIMNVVYLCKCRPNNKPKNNEIKFRSQKSLASFEQFQKIESGEQQTLTQVYSNGNCPHCGTYINLSSIKPRYFAFDRNICRECYGKFMENTMN